MDIGDLTIQQFVERFSGALPALERAGLGKFSDPQVRESLGSILKLRTALAMASIDLEKFGEQLAWDQTEDDPGAALSEDYGAQSSLSMLGLLPCGMKMPFKRRFEAFTAGLNGPDAPRCLVEGNVNHELSYYPYIDTLQTIDELPDVIVSSDINAFFHQSFRERFIASGAFESLDLAAGNPDFAGTDYLDPGRAYTMLSANILILVVNKALAGDLLVPKRWEDLMDPRYEDTVTMRGQGQFFCSGVLLPLLKDYGEDGIRRMSRSVVRGVHPSEMVKEIEKGQGTPFYIMPLFFAQRLKREEAFTFVYPEEGAIISPVFMLVKRGRREEARKLAGFIMGREMGQFCADAGFPSVRSDVDNKLPEGCRLSWMGWDFLRGDDPLRMKRRITEIFNEKFAKGADSQ